MKKSIFFLLLFFVVSLMAQDAPASFPRKTLMEHFSGSSCGYCPYGMNLILDYISTQDPSTIWVCHHSYGKDEYKITENTQIANIFNISGAPYVVLNRTKYTGTTIPFDPSAFSRIEFTDTLAEASVTIQHTFDADTRQLDVSISGQVLNATDTAYLLTVLIKENHLVGAQADQVNTWKQSPWREFMHARVVRDVLTTSAYGDTVCVQDQAYSHTLTYSVNSEWVPENCCIVAYITPLNKRPIINAEQVPLVVGTTGGEEYLPYGITESAKPMTSIAFDSLQVTQLSDSLLEVLLIDNSNVRSIYGYPVRPVVRAYICTESTTLQAGTYPVQADGAMGSMIAGYRNDLAAQLQGSLLMVVPVNQLNQGKLLPDSQWRIDSGTMTVATDGSITFNFTTYNKTAVKTTYTAPTTSLESITAPVAQPQKIMHNQRMLILHDGTYYDILGNAIP